MDAFFQELDTATARGSNTIPAVVVGAVDRTGQLIHSHATGYTSANPNSSLINLSSTFFLGSATKIITAIAALQCVERGLITLDEPVSTVLPELPKLEILTMNPPSEDPTSPKFSLTPTQEKITLRHLLTHTSGISYDSMDPRMQAWRASRGEGPLSMTGNLIQGFSTPLVHEPGTSFTYGGNYDWAGLLVGRLNGTTFGEYCEENIFQPLGMESATFHLEQKESTREKLVGMSARGAGGVLEPGETGFADPAADEFGGTGLYISAPDFLKALADLLKDQPVTLKPATVQLLFTPQLEEGGAAHQALNAMAPFAWAFFMSDTDIRPNHGLGSLLVTEEGRESGTPAGTIRWSGYTGPMWAVNREKGRAWFYATQVAPYGDVESGKRAQDFGRLVFAGL